MKITWYDGTNSRVKKTDVVSVSSYGIYFLSDTSIGEKLSEYKYSFVGQDERKNIIVVFTNNVKNGAVPYSPVVTSYRGSANYGISVNCSKFMKDNYTFTNSRVKRVFSRVYNAEGVDNTDKVYCIDTLERDIKNEKR